MPSSETPNDQPQQSHMTPEQEAQWERLVDTAGLNATEARERVTGEPQAPVELPREVGSTAVGDGASLRPPRKPRTPKEKAAADTRPDLKPFPYGHQDRF